MRSRYQINVEFVANVLNGPIIEGHTDTQGGESFNQRLSDRRSAWVAAELSRRGVAKSRMITKAFGESAPADDKGDEHPWANNRRVEIRIAETNR